VYNVLLADPNISQYSLNKKLCAARGTYNTMYDKIKSGWVPSDDPAFILWLTEYNKTKEAEDAA